MNIKISFIFSCAFYALSAVSMDINLLPYEEFIRWFKIDREEKGKS